MFNVHTYIINYQSFGDLVIFNFCSCSCIGSFHVGAFVESTGLAQACIKMKTWKFLATLRIKSSCDLDVAFARPARLAERQGRPADRGQDHTQRPRAQHISR